MVRIITHIIITAFAILVVAAFVPGIVVTGLAPAVIGAVALGVLNVLVRPILFILTLPVTLITFGIFVLVLNAWMFWIAASFVPGFSVTGFWPALIGSVVVSVVSTLLSIDRKKE